MASDLVVCLMQNHVPICPRCGHQLKWDQDDSLKSSVEFVSCPLCNFKEVIEFVKLKELGQQEAGNGGVRPDQR